MIKFEITLLLTAEELAEFLSRSNVVGRPMTINPVRDAAPAASPKATPSRAENRIPRKPRGSKVELAIREALAHGAAATATIKQKLEDAGLKPNSFGTVAYKMQKEGLLSRTNGGEWTLGQ